MHIFIYLTWRYVVCLFDFFNVKVCCVFSLESPHRGDSDENTKYTIFNIKKNITLNYSKSAAMGFFPKGLKNIWNSHGKWVISVRGTAVLLSLPILSLQIIAPKRLRNNSKQWRPWSGCSFGSSLNWTCSVRSYLYVPVISCFTVHKVKNGDCWLSEHKNSKSDSAI